jgi:hypothetical protein
MAAGPERRHRSSPANCRIEREQTNSPASPVQLLQAIFSWETPLLDPLGADRGGKLTSVSDRLPLYVRRSVYAKHIQRRIFGLALSLSSWAGRSCTAPSSGKFHSALSSDQQFFDLQMQEQGIEPQTSSRRRADGADCIHEVAKTAGAKHANKASPGTVYTSKIGTFETSNNVCSRVAFRGKAEVPQTSRNGEPVS